MPVVLRGITIWTFYALVSCASIAVCLSAEDVVRWELMFDPVSPVQRYASGRANKRIATAAATVSSSVLVKAGAPACNCTQVRGHIELEAGHYPWLIPSSRCESSQWCAEVTYTVLVLKRLQRQLKRTGGATNVQRARWVPDELRGDWTFVEVDVVAGCSCSC